MDAATQIRVFEPFSPPGWVKGVWPGTGDFAQHCNTRMLGGSLLVQSAPGEGTCFTLEFPCTAPWPVPGGGYR